MNRKIWHSYVCGAFFQRSLSELIEQSWQPSAICVIMNPSDGIDHYLCVCWECDCDIFPPFNTMTYPHLVGIWLVGICWVTIIMITTIHHDDNSSDGKHSGGTVDKWCALSQSAFFVTLTLCYSFSYFSMYQNMYFFSCQKKNHSHTVFHISQNI